MRRTSHPGMLACLWLVTLPATGVAQVNSILPPIQGLNGLTAKPEFYRLPFRSPPLVLKSDSDAHRVLTDDSVTQLTKKADWKRQVVLVFAWQGSGQDQIRFDVLESDPEQIDFEFVAGRTKDLRRHCVILLLRNDVSWHLRGRRGANPQTALPKKLEHPVVLRDAQTGFAGVSGHLWTIGSDGQWKHQTFLNEMVRKPHEAGQLTEAELGQLIEAIENARLADLPATLGKAPQVNPHEFSIQYGKARTVLLQTGGSRLPDTSDLPADAPLTRFVALARTIQQLVQVKTEQ